MQRQIAKRWTSAFAFAAFIACGIPVWAGEGDGGASGVGRGGDPARVIPKDWYPLPFDYLGPGKFVGLTDWFMVIDSLVRTDLKPMLLTFLQEMKSADLASAASRAKMERLIQNGLLEDVRTSRYGAHWDLCPSEDGPAAESAVEGRWSGTICLSVPYFAETDWGPLATWAVLSAVAVHGHSHQLKINDHSPLPEENLSLVKDVADLFAKFLGKRRCAFNLWFQQYWCAEGTIPQVRH